LHSQQPDSWKTIAWNGITFAIPDYWYPTVILQNHLVFEADYLPVFEIKWQQGKRAPSLSSLFGRLQKKQNIQIVPWNVAPEWFESLNAYHVDGFSWSADGLNSYNGYGLLLVDATKEFVVILQFHNLKEHHLPQFTPLITSLSPQEMLPDTALVPWAIFDIQAQLPATAQLKSHEFFPGKYSLAFTFQKHHLTLMRFKPAKELLRNTRLVGFGNQLTQNKLRCCHAEDKSKHRHQATWRYEAQGKERLLRSLRRQPTCRMLQLTYHIAENVILGVQMEGNSKSIFDTTLLIARTFKPVSA